jgi:hypothetical protein
MVILPVQVPANRAAPIGFDFRLEEDFVGFAAGATVGPGVGLSGTSWIGAGKRCAVVTRSANAIKQTGVRIRLTRIRLQRCNLFCLHERQFAEKHFRTSTAIWGQNWRPKISVKNYMSRKIEQPIFG